MQTLVLFLLATISPPTSRVNHQYLTVQLLDPLALGAVLQGNATAYHAATENSCRLRNFINFNPSS